LIIPFPAESIAYFPPPLKQIASGIEPENVTCTEGLELVFKSTNNSPACVKPQTVEKLIERGWALPNQSIHEEQVFDSKLEIQRIGEEWHKEVFEDLSERFEKKAEFYYAEINIEFEGAETILDTTVYEHQISWVDNVTILGEWNDKQCEDFLFMLENISYCERDKGYEKKDFLDEGILEIIADEKRVKQIRLFLNYKEKQETIPSHVAGLHDEIVRTMAPHLINDSKYLSWASGMMEKKFQSTKQFGSIKTSLDSDWDGFFEFIMEIG